MANPMMSALSQLSGGGAPPGGAPMQPSGGAPLPASGPSPSGGPAAPSQGSPADLIVMKMQELNMLMEDLITSGMPMPADALAPELQSFAQNLALISARDAGGAEAQQGAQGPMPPGGAPAPPGGGQMPPMPQMPQM